MGRRSNRAYIFSSSVAFVPHPLIGNLWVRTHPCVLLTACDSCGSDPGELCRNAAGDIVMYTHLTRKNKINSKRSCVVEMPPAIVQLARRNK